MEMNKYKANEILFNQGKNIAKLIDILIKSNLFIKEIENLLSLINKDNFNFEQVIKEMQNKINQLIKNNTSIEVLNHSHSEECNNGNGKFTSLSHGWNGLLMNQQPSIINCLKQKEYFESLNKYYNERNIHE